MKLDEKVLPQETAILILDIQNDFCHENGAFSKVLGWDAAPIRSIVPKLGLFVDEARARGCKIIWSQMMNHLTSSPSNLVERLSVGFEKSAGNWPFGLAEGSWGWEIYNLKPAPTDVVLTKRYFDLLSVPGLLDQLRGVGICTLVVAGVYTEVCIAATAQRGFSEGFNMVIPRDLVASVVHRTETAATVLGVVGGYCAEVTTSKEIVTAWQK